MGYDINRFHLCVFVTCQFASFFGGQNLFGIYSTHVPKWKCGNSEPTSNCSIYVSCNKNDLTFVDTAFLSAAIEFDWLCGPNTIMKTYLNQFQFVGVLFGTILFGSLSDKFGRKPIGIMVTLTAICFTVVNGKSPTVEILFISRFVVGLSIGGIIVVLKTWTMELILPQQRMVVRGLFNWGWTRIFITTVCYFTQEWRLATMTFAVFLLPVLFMIILVLPESPVWLHSKGFTERMVKSEMYIAKMGRVPYVPVRHEYIHPKGLIAILKTKGLFKKLNQISDAINYQGHILIVGDMNQ